MTRSQLWASGTGLVGGQRIDPGNVLDIAPTILAALGVALPPWLDGRPLPLSAAGGAAEVADVAQRSAFFAAD